MDLWKVAGLRHAAQRLEDPGNPHLARLRDLWEDRRTGRALPDRSDFDLPFDVRPWMRNLMILDVVRDPLDFRARLVGEEVERIEQRRYVGKPLAEAGYGPLEPAIRAACEVAATGQRVSMLYTVTIFGLLAKKVEVLYLPLSKGAACAELILCGIMEVRGGADRAPPETGG